ncbi:hypothetical protein M8C21_013427, partial [Ambrosia artemisiifolia]
MYRLNTTKQTIHYHPTPCVHLISSPTPSPTPKPNMFIPIRTFLLWLTVMFIYSKNTITRAQPPEFLDYKCENAANYTQNSTYQRNLNTTLSALPSTNSGLGFFNFSSGQGTNRVNSIALCRGDINLDVCLSCLNDSIVNLLQLCPNQKEARGYYDYCMVLYSNKEILGNNPIQDGLILYNVQNVTDKDRFNAALRPLLRNLTTDAAAGDSLRKFSSGNTTSGLDFSTIYGLVQCTPDLSQLECSDCVESAISQFMVGYSDKVGGRNLLPMCNFSTFVIPSPPPSSPAPQPNSRASPPVSSSAETVDIGNAESLQYNFSLVKVATNGFSEDNKLGQGGFGAVYKGTLGDGQDIAVKRLARDSGQGDVDGYMAPEYAMHGQFSLKSDVWKNWRSKTLTNVTDPTLKAGSASLRDIIRSI